MPQVDETVIKRVMPHSVEAEQSVIGSMIMDREAIVVASDVVTGDDFYNKQYGVLFDTMVELNNEGQPVDIVTLQNRLKEKDVPPEISSLEYVKALLDTVVTSANVKYYAQIVADKVDHCGDLISMNEEIANICYCGQGAYWMCITGGDGEKGL